MKKFIKIFAFTLVALVALFLISCKGNKVEIKIAEEATSLIKFKEDFKAD